MSMDKSHCKAQCLALYDTKEREGHCVACVCVCVSTIWLTVCAQMCFVCACCVREKEREQ